MSDSMVEGSYRNKATVEDIMKYGVITVKPDTPVYSAIASLAEREITGLPVVDDDMRLKGVITEKDVMKLLYSTHSSAGLVREFMTEDVVSFNSDDPLIDVYNCLANSYFRRVTIKQDDKLVSVISRTDLIYENKDKFRPIDLPPRIESKFVIAKNFMKKGLITVKRDMPIYKVMELLSENKLTGLPVVDNDMQIEGIITEKDIIGLLTDPLCKPGNVEKYMTTDVITFNTDDGLRNICSCLIENHFRRVPIVEDGKLVGIVSRADIIDAILRHSVSLFRRRKTDA